MDEEEVPTGRSFFQVARTQEDLCAKQTDLVLPKLGERAPKTYEQLGTVLSLLDRVASCYWACVGGDHAIERLAGRASSNITAGVSLMRFGFYDEALGLARSAGEICNLLQLFLLEAPALDDWRRLDGVRRRKVYSPFNVRLRLETVAGRPIIQQDRYSALSGFAAHPDPDNPPQAHNALGVPSLGGYFQEAGLLMSLNELGLAAGGVLFLAASLAHLEPARLKECREAGIALIRSLGAVEVVTREAMWAAIPRADDP